MAQFYFLSVLLNILCGLICVYNQNTSEIDTFEDFEDEEFSDANEKKIPGVKKIQEGIKGESLFTNPLFTMVTGALSLIVGIVILCVPYKGPAVIGDFFPALTLLAGGGAVLLGYFQNASDSFSAPEILETIMVEHKLYIGIVCLLFGILHFIIPGVPIL